MVQSSVRQIAPRLFGGPPAGSARDRDAAHVVSVAEVAVVDQDVAIGGQGRLHDTGARRQRVLPEHLAVGRRDAGRAASAQQQNLRDSADRQ